MQKAKVIDQKGAVKAEIDLPEGVFGYPAKTSLVHEATVNVLANRRRGTVATKTRAMVSGSNRKPWKQKGTGRARAGATRNPLWRKGGITFGPQPRDFSYALPKEVKRNALRAALVHPGGDVALQVLEVGVAVVGQHLARQHGAPARAAVEHHVPILRYFGEPRGELVVGNVDRARHVPGDVFLGRPHVEHVRRLRAIIETLNQRLLRHGGEGRVARTRHPRRERKKGGRDDETA